MTYILGMGSTLNRWFPASCWTVKLLAQGITAVTPWASVFQFWSTPTAAHLKWRHTKTIFLMVWIVHIYIVSYSTTFLTSTKTSCNTYVFADAVLSFPFAKLVCLSTSCYKPRSYRSFVRIWRNWTSAKSAWALTTWRSDEKIPRSDMKWHSMTDLQLRCQFTYHWYYRWYNIAAIAIEELLWSVRSSYIFDMGSAVSPNVSCGFQNLKHNVRFAVRMDLWTFSFSFRVLKCPQTWCFIISFRIGIAIFWVSPIYRCPCCQLLIHVLPTAEENKKLRSRHVLTCLGRWATSSCTAQGLKIIKVSYIHNIQTYYICIYIYVYVCICIYIYTLYI